MRRPLPDRAAPVFAHVVSPSLGWYPSASLLFIIFYGLQVVARDVHRSSLRRLICPAQDHFIFLTVLIISMTCVLSLTQMLVFLFLYVMLSILISILVCASRKFVLCLFGQCPVLFTIFHSWQHTGVVHLSLQADCKVAFEYIPVFGVCRPACHYSSLYLFVLVLFLEAVVLSQVHVAFNIFYQRIVHVYRGVRLLSSDSSCEISCNTHILLQQCKPYLVSIDLHAFLK